jgi:P27 family predicted phage terminase small subunit
MSTVDRAAFAAYCQAYARWVEAEQKLQETPLLLKTPSGYVQQSPWLSISNKQLELMGRYMGELGLTPASRARVSVPDDGGTQDITFQVVYMHKDGTRRDREGNIIEQSKDDQGVIALNGDL